ncbi:PAS domain-containing protein, partial [Candidatus Entotheonella palauensis]|uniref:PAS domain-containing protein n=1 Tax=Candidatus Entotheonella palauensis TaxID=93172 RepID=UPI0015C47457
MQDAEYSQNTLIDEFDTLQQQLKILESENTELRQRINEQERSLTFLDAIIQYLPTPVFVKDAHELRFVRLNQAGETLLGFSQEEIIGKTDYDFFPEAEAVSFTRKDEYVLSQGRLEDIAEEPIHTRSQGVRLLHTKKIPIYDWCRDTFFGAWRVAKGLV